MSDEKERLLAATGRPQREEEELNEYNCVQSSRCAIVSRMKTDPA